MFIEGTPIFHPNHDGSLQIIRQGDPKFVVILCPRIGPLIRPTITNWLAKNLAPHDIVLVDMPLSATPLDPRWHDSTSQIAGKIEIIGAKVFGWNQIIPPTQHETHRQIQMLRGYQAFLEASAHELPDAFLLACNLQWIRAQNDLNELTRHSVPIEDHMLLSPFFNSLKSFANTAHPLGGKVIGIFENRTIPLEFEAEASQLNPTVMCPSDAFDHTTTLR